jgi:hypothetical protein
MPASFGPSLCGYRDGKPNTSDASQAMSVELGQLMFDRMGIDRHKVADAHVDGLMTSLMIDDLRNATRAARQGTSVDANGRLSGFEQFAHLAVLPELSKGVSKDVQTASRALNRYIRGKITRPADVQRLELLIEKLSVAMAEEESTRRRLLERLGDESLLKLDIAMSRHVGDDPDILPHLLAGLSLKWSLRTDRAQDCRSQGAKMSALRRGRMPHFAAVTMEPRPQMLVLLGRGSGDVDCVYHLALPALIDAVDEAGTGSNARRKMRDTLRQLVEQRRVRDYDELVAYVSTL